MLFVGSWSQGQQQPCNQINDSRIICQGASQTLSRVPFGVLFLSSDQWGAFLGLTPGSQPGGVSRFPNLKRSCFFDPAFPVGLLCACGGRCRNDRARPAAAVRPLWALLPCARDIRRCGRRDDAVASYHGRCGGGAVAEGGCGSGAVAVRREALCRLVWCGPARELRHDTGTPCRGNHVVVHVADGFGLRKLP